MTVRELNADQMHELKENYLCELDQEGRFAEVYGEDAAPLSQGHLCAADELVSDEDMYKRYDGTNFTEDDFLCSCN